MEGFTETSNANKFRKSFERGASAQFIDNAPLSLRNGNQDFINNVQDTIVSCKVSMAHWASISSDNWAILLSHKIGC